MMKTLVSVMRGGERGFQAAPLASSSCGTYGSTEAEQTGWMLANISCVQDGAVVSLTLSLHIQRQMFPRARVGG